MGWMHFFLGALIVNGKLIISKTDMLAVVQDKYAILKKLPDLTDC